MFTYLAVLDLSCGMWELFTCGVGLSSLTRDWTWAPCTRSSVLPLDQQGSRKSFASLRILYKWNHAAWNFVFFPLSIQPLKSIQVIACITSLFIFIVENNSMVSMYHSLFNHSPIVGHILVVSSLGLLQSKRLWTILHRFLCEHKFSFRWDKCPGLRSLGCRISVCLAF